MDRVSALQSLATGLGRARRGLGIIGPFGNTDAALSPGTDYQITGDGVYMWNGPQSNAGSISDANGNSIFLNRGDIVHTPAEAARVELDVGNGKYYALVTSSKAPNESGVWVAVQYLAPTSWKAPATAPPPDEKPPVAMTGEPSAAWKPWLIGGLALLGTGGVLYMLFGKKGLLSHGKRRKRARR